MIGLPSTSPLHETLEPREVHLSSEHLHEALHGIQRARTAARRATVFASFGANGRGLHGNSALPTDTRPSERAVFAAARAQARLRAAFEHRFATAEQHRSSHEATAYDAIFRSLGDETIGAADLASYTRRAEIELTVRSRLARGVFD